MLLLRPGTWTWGEEMKRQVIWNSTWKERHKQPYLVRNHGKKRSLLWTEENKHPHRVGQLGKLLQSVVFWKNKNQKIIRQNSAACQPSSLWFSPCFCDAFIDIKKSTPPRRHLCFLTNWVYLGHFYDSLGTMPSGVQNWKDAALKIHFAILLCNGRCLGKISENASSGTT